MKKLLILFSFICLLWTQSFAQKSDAEKIMLYETAKKSGTTAVILSCLISSAGHAYAGNWARGLLFTAGRIGFGVLAFTAGTKTTMEQQTYYYAEQKVEHTSAYYVGIMGIAVLAIWEMIDANNEVKKYNQRLFEQIVGKKPEVGFIFFKDNSRKGNIIPGLTLSLKF